MRCPFLYGALVFLQFCILSHNFSNANQKQITSLSPRAVIIIPSRHQLQSKRNHFSAWATVNCWVSSRCALVILLVLAIRYYSIVSPYFRTLPLTPSFPIEKNSILPSSDRQSPSKCLMCPCDFVIFSHSIFDIQSSHHIFELFPSSHHFPSTRILFSPQATANHPVSAWCVQSCLWFVGYFLSFDIRSISHHLFQTVLPPHAINSNPKEITSALKRLPIFQ